MSPNDDSKRDGHARPPLVGDVVVLQVAVADGHRGLRQPDDAHGPDDSARAVSDGHPQRERTPSGIVADGLRQRRVGRRAGRARERDASPRDERAAPRHHVDGRRGGHVEVGERGERGGIGQRVAARERVAADERDANGGSLGGTVRLPVHPLEDAGQLVADVRDGGVADLLGAAGRVGLPRARRPEPPSAA